jgi:dihydroflavonol-4-reductase
LPSWPKYILITTTAFFSKPEPEVTNLRALVLGATGFIGGHIARAALEAGWEVRGLRRRASRTGHLEDLPIAWVRGDLKDYASLRLAMDRVDVVFHAAAFYPSDGNPRKVREQVSFGIRETQNVLAAVQAAKVHRFVYTSTLTTIGHPPPEENRLADERDIYMPGTIPKSAYYETKIAMEQTVLDSVAQKIPAVVLNPTAVFGPGDVNLGLGGLLIAVAQGKMIGWLPGEANVVDVRDVAQAHITAAENGEIGERYIIGGHNYTVKEAFTIATNVAGVKAPRFEIPLWVLKGFVGLGDLLPFLPVPANHLRTVEHWQGYNCDKAQNSLGLSPRSFRHTVRDALDWFRNTGYI